MSDETIGYPITDKDEIVKESGFFRIAVGESGYDNNPCIKLALRDCIHGDIIVQEMHLQDTVELIQALAAAILEYR